jgi:hypothetical protein
MHPRLLKQMGARWHSQAMTANAAADMSLRRAEVKAQPIELSPVSR